jgi:hypothetical protein
LHRSESGARPATAGVTDGFRTRARSFALRVGERLLRDFGVPARDDNGVGSVLLMLRGLNGAAGFAILHGALGALPAGDRFAAAMHARLRQAALANDRPSIGLFTGISGLRAAAALAARAEPRYGRLVAQCDAFIDAQTAAPSANLTTFGTYDVIEGWSGALLARGIGAPVAEDPLVEAILWALDDPERWRCPHPIKPLEPAVNDLGLAHGVAGMLAALALTLAGLEGATAATAARAMRDLVDRRIAIGDCLAWPSTAQSDGTGPYRSAWCYGAPGVIAAIYVTAEALGDRERAAFAVDAMCKLAAQPVESWLLEGEALCHGLTGNALCFASVAAAAGSGELWDAALRLAGDALDRLEANGDTCLARGFPDGWYDAVGLLDGACGVALGLLTLAGDADASWMRLFGLRPIA